AFRDAPKLLARLLLLLGFGGGRRLGVGGSLERRLLRRDDRGRVDRLAARSRMRDRVVARLAGRVLRRLLRFGRGRRAIRSALERRFLRSDEISAIDRPVARQGSLGFAILLLILGGARLDLPPHFALALVLRPDRLEFHVDHPGWHREVVTLGELVEQRTL